MKRVHKNFKAFDSGLTLYKEKPYIGASADLETECDCCGVGLCEIKCPEKIKDVKPCEANVEYIKDGTVNKNHQYFYQIQGQMGILGRTFCDLFIFTIHGTLKVRVSFDNDVWKIILEKLCWFWNDFILPEILKPMLDLNESECGESDIENEKDYLSLDDNNNNAVGSRTKNTESKAKGKKKCTEKLQVVKRQNVQLCGKCVHVCVDDPKSVEEDSVSCDICKVWYHFLCVDLKQINEDDEWVCTSCK
jgi:hypothetical protein